jgi:branched-chain amino acid aminotransferase
MITKIWFDGALVDLDSARIPYNSPSARYGLTVFEGIRSYMDPHNGSHLIFRLDDHINRFYDSARALDLFVDSTPEIIFKAIEKLIHANDVRNDCYILI